MSSQMTEDKFSSRMDFYFHFCSKISNLNSPSLSLFKSFLHCALLVKVLWNFESETTLPARRATISVSIARLYSPTFNKLLFFHFQYRLNTEHCISDKPCFKKTCKSLHYKFKISLRYNLHGLAVCLLVTANIYIFDIQWDTLRRVINVVLCNPFKANILNTKWVVVAVYF